MPCSDLRQKLPKAVTALAKAHSPRQGIAYIHCTAGDKECWVCAVFKYKAALLTTHFEFAAHNSDNFTPLLLAPQ